MTRQCLFGFSLLLSGIASLIGCTKAPPSVVIPVAETRQAEPKTAETKAPQQPAAGFELSPAGLEQEGKADGLLRAALNLTAEKKYADALNVLEAARALQDTEEIRQEIERVKALLTQKDAAEKTVQEIHAVLKDGNAEEAARLAQAGLQRFGGGDEAERLALLKQQADALRAAAVEDRDTRRQRFLREGEAALKENNLRAAAIAFDLAIEAGADADLRRQLEEIRERLARYDDQRRRAAELRRDPGQLEEAIEALQRAAEAWDTLQVRQEIDEYHLALQKRRQRLSVADFEVRGEVGIPLAGRTIAEELLPAFKVRFDVVERGQLAQIIEELKLQPDELVDNDAGRREVGRLARVRYLVLGSVSPLGGVTVNARLVDLRTGLIVQTGKIVGHTPEEVIKLLPQLAAMLTMTDEERIALENKLLQQALQEVRPVEGAAPLPPPPEPPVPNGGPGGALPPPLIVNPRPPAIGVIRPNDFDRLPLLVPGQPPPPPPVVILPPPLRQRLLFVSLEIGDNLFRRGLYREAHRHFELALNLAPGEVDIRLRIDRVQPFLPPPPPPPVVILPVPPPLPPPRIAVLNFIVYADPLHAPPGFADWVSAYFAARLAPWYEVVDRGELFWYMGRLGLTVQDVLNDPWARRSLAQALNVRFFVFGVVQQTASFNVQTHLVDGETGVRHGVGSIHVQDRDEMKLRLGELVQQMRRDPSQRDQFLREAQEHEKQINEIRQLLRQGNAAQAAALGRRALQQRPGDVALQALVIQAERTAQEKALAEARQKEAEKRKAQLLAAQRRQEELAREAEQARLKAEKEAQARDEAARKAQEQQRDKAHADLMAKAHTALQKKDFAQAIKLLQSAVALKPTDAGFQELAQAKALQESENKARAEQEKLKREAEKKKQEEEVARIRAQLEEQRKAREAEELKRRKAQEERDNAAYAKLLENAQDMLQQKRFDAAIQMLVAAKQLKATDEVQRLLKDARDQQAQAEAEKKGAAARAALEKRLAEEKALREKAEAEAKQKQEKYSQALQQAQKALAAKDFDEAIQHYREAIKLFRTDVALNGLRQAQEAQAKERARVEAEKRQKADEAQKAARVKQLLADGHAALQAKQFGKAIQLFTEANKLAPTNVEVLAGLSKAELARDDAAVEARRQKEDQDRQARFQKHLDDGKAKLAKKDFDGAAKEANEALKLKPGDREAAALLKDVDTARTAAAAAAKAKQREAEVDRLLKQGRTALAAKDLTAAAKAFEAAAILAPQDPDVLRAQQDLQKAQASAKADAEAKAKLADFQAFLKKARQALARYQYDDALGLLIQAEKLIPGDKEAAALRQQIEKERAEAKVAEAKKRQADFQAQLHKARQALAAKRFDDALAALNEADKLIPGNKETAAFRKEAQQGKKDAEDAEAKAAAAKKRQADFNKLMAAGQNAMTAKRFDDAVKMFQEALKLMPNDPTAIRALAEARKALEASKVPSKPTPQEEYAKQMQAGSAAEKQQQFEAAIKAYQEALRLMPGDAKATAALRNAQYQDNLADGNKALKAKRFSEAARAFEAALKLKPGDPEATEGLKKAKAGK